MHIALLGLGYVGTTTAACLARDGHYVYGVDINPEKTRAVAEGRSPVVEPGVAALLEAAVAAGRVLAGPSLEPWLDRLDMVMVCVGTPSRADGKLDLSHLLEVTRGLGRRLRERDDAALLLLVFRSTMPPGTMDRLVLPTLERACGEPPGRRYEVAFNPEFLRESTAIRDYDAPPKVVIGERAPGVTRRLLGIYDRLEAPFFEVGFGVAETVKLVDNCWHATKVAFANEMGRIAVSKGIDPQAVAEIFLADTKLNLGSYYLRPGGPFGGSCLPKDLGAMLSLARDAGIAVPVMSGAKESNAGHLVWLFQRVAARLPAPGPILLLGLSFKAGTDDLRNSPLLELAELLVEAGYALEVYDPDLEPERLVGVNFALALEHEGVLADRLTPDLDGAVDRARLVILGKPIPGIRDRLPQGTDVLDVTRLGGL